MTTPQKITTQVRLPVTPEMDRETLENQYYALCSELADTKEELIKLSDAPPEWRDAVSDPPRTPDGSSGPVLVYTERYQIMGAVLRLNTLDELVWHEFSWYDTNTGAMKIGLRISPTHWIPVRSIPELSVDTLRSPA